MERSDLVGGFALLRELAARYISICRTTLAACGACNVRSGSRFGAQLRHAAAAAQPVTHGCTADHLRRKWQSAGGSITTAKQFIDEVATKSSLSGERYRVRLADGRDVSSQELLSAELARLEDPVPASQPSGPR